MLRPRTPARQQLGEVLARRRRDILRADAGLPAGGRRGDRGLSREEVATLSGVSASWYTWLEQGRAINVSRQVLHAVARVLQLTRAELDFVLALAADEVPPEQEPVDQIPEHLQRLVDALPFPAFVVATDWAIAGWNSAYEWLYPRIRDLDPGDRNLLWLVYTDPELRRLLPDWDRDSRRFLAEFRAETGLRITTARHRALVERLFETSADFRVHWKELSVERFESRLRTFVHPSAGEVVFEHQRLVPSDSPDLHIVVYQPVEPSA